MSLLYEKVVQEDLNVGTSTVTVSNPGGGSLTGTQIGIHSVAVGQVAHYETFDAGSIAAGSYESEEITVPGAAVGDFAIAALSSILTDDIMLSAHVSAADTVKVLVFNPTASPVDLGSGNLSVLVFKSR